MRKVFRISYEKAYEVREGLYYAVPHDTYGLREETYMECCHHEIVVDKGGKVWLYDLAEVPNFPEEDWVVFYGLDRSMGETFDFPPAPEWGPIPEIRIGIPYRYLLDEKIPQDRLREFVGWVKEYLAQLDLLAAAETAAAAK